MKALRTIQKEKRALELAKRRLHKSLNRFGYDEIKDGDFLWLQGAIWALHWAAADVKPKYNWMKVSRPLRKLFSERSWSDVYALVDLKDRRKPGGG